MVLKTILKEYIDNIEIITGISNPLIDCITTEKAIKAKGLKITDKNRTNLIKQNAVYFIPKKNEEIITDNEAKIIEQKLINAKEKKSFLKRDKSEIVDNRNETFIKIIDNNNYEKVVIEKLSDTIPPDYKNSKELTEQEKETVNNINENNRIKGLSSEQKIQEKQNKIEEILNQSAMLKNKLEILNDSEALIKAQAFYNLEKEKIGQKYK